MKNDVNSKYRGRHIGSDPSGSDVGFHVQEFGFGSPKDLSTREKNREKLEARAAANHQRREREDQRQHA